MAAMRRRVFFLLRPGEYCRGGTDTAQHPFRIKDVKLIIVQQPYKAAKLSNSVLAQADYVSFLFTTQNNGIKSKSIGHGCTVHHQGCPLAAMHRQVAYLRRHGATSKTPLSIFNKATKWQQIRGDDITAAIRVVAQAAGPEIGFTDVEISARFLQGGGAMAFFVAQVDPDTIRLVGRWRSDTMLH